MANNCLYIKTEMPFWKFVHLWMHLQQLFGFIIYCTTVCANVSLSPLQVYTCDIYLRQIWHDHGFDFRHILGEGEVLVVPDPYLDLIWKPDTFIQNSRMEHVHTVTQPNRALFVYANGTMFYSNRYSSHTETEMTFWRNFHHWVYGKMSFSKLPLQPVMNIWSKWHFHGNVFRITGSLWLESVGLRQTPLIKGQWCRAFDAFFAVSQNKL